MNFRKTIAVLILIISAVIINANTSYGQAVETIQQYDEKSETKKMSPKELVPLLVKSIQEQQSQIASLEARIAKLEKLVLKK